MNNTILGCETFFVFFFVEVRGPSGPMATGCNGLAVAGDGLGTGGVIYC